MVAGLENERSVADGMTGQAAGRMAGWAQRAVARRTTPARPRTRQLRRQRQVLAGTLLISDVSMLLFAFWLAWYVRIGSGWLGFHAPAELPGYLPTMLSAVIVMLPLFALQRLYSYNLLLGGPQEYANVVRACSYGVVALVFLGFLERSEPLPRGWLLASWGFAILFVGVARLLLRRLFYWLRRRYGWFRLRALVVGANDHARAIARQLTASDAGVQIVGFVDDFLPAGTTVLDDAVVLGSPSELHELASRHGVEQVIVLPNAVAWETFQDVMHQAAYANGFEVQLSPGFYEILTTSVEVTHKGFVPLLRVEQLRITGIDRVLKALLDFGLGSILFLVTAPVMGALAGVLWLLRGRPILDRQPMLGRSGVPFRTTRFHTSRRAAPASPTGADGGGTLGDVAALSAHIGALLYRTGLDKLPQLYDVLRGRMSLVGPRLVALGQEHELQHWLPNLLTVKPGWVGPWAVGSFSTRHEEILVDQFYVRNWTIWLDLQVLFQAARRALGARSRSQR